jgi:hypothetical protein
MDIMVDAGFKALTKKMFKALRPMNSMESMDLFGPKALNEIRLGFSPGNSPWGSSYFTKPFSMEAITFSTKVQPKL